MTRSATLAAGLMTTLSLVNAQAAPQSALACDNPAATSGMPRLHVTAHGAHSSAGNVTFTLYGEDPSRFLKPRGSLLVTRAPITGEHAELCFAVSAPGTYAVAIYHDENNNHHFDRNFLGLPAEGYGFSNDAPTLFGPPSFSAARVLVHAGNQEISIGLRY